MCQGITDEQGRLLASWLGAFSVVRDYSWPLQDTTVLHIVAPPGEEFIVKASTTSHHIRREIAAHAAGFEGLAGRVPVPAARLGAGRDPGDRIPAGDARGGDPGRG